MTQATNDWLAEIEAEEKRERDRLPAAKAALLAALKKTPAALVTIEYDGEGDSGQITGIAAVSTAGRPSKLRGSITLDLHGQSHEYKTLNEALDEFAWAVLRAYHGGFENNEGGFGNLVINVRTGEVILDHNDRITEVCNSVTEV